MPLNLTDHIPKSTKEDMSLLETPNQFPPFITGNEAGDATGNVQVNRDSRGENAGQHDQVCRIIASSLQILDPTTEASRLIIVRDQRALNHSVASDKDPCERTMSQLEGIRSEAADTTANQRGYKLGKFTGQSKCFILQTVMASPSTTIRNERVQISIS